MEKRLFQFYLNDRYDEVTYLCEGPFFRMLVSRVGKWK